MSEHEENLRDFAAMFAMCGLVSRHGHLHDTAQVAYEIADSMMEYRNRQDDGIASINTKRKYERKPKD
jgi:hypothetical protein